MSAVTGGQAQRAAPVGVKPPLGVPRRLLRMRSDAALAERFAAGDELAFDVIYERHRSVVLAVSMGVLGTSQDAEDATQETFSALAVALRSKPPVELRPWLIRVARNASIDTTRRRRHRLLTLDGEIPDVPARHQAAGQAELAVVLDGIRELPEGQRMALLMRELGGHTYLEIAEFLETDEEAVKGLIARARVGLRTYREATELPCTTARSAIAAEPDGRRYDKTIRRHLRSCASCRAYRSALRDDAKVLRAALPLQTGTVATGGISTGMLTAAKGTLVGYGITQAATTCAASACAVGAIGGMVLVTPVHKLGLPLIGPARSAPAPAHISSRPADKHTVVLRHTAVTGSGTGAQPLKKAAAATSHATTRNHAKAGAAAGAIHHHRRITVTKVKLPNLPAAAATGTAQSSASAPPAGAGAPVTQSSAPVATTTPSQTPVTQSATAIGSGTQSTANQGTQGTGSAGYGTSWASGDPSGSTSSQSQSGNGTFNGNPTTSVVRAGGWQGGFGGGTTTSTVTSPTDTTSTVTSPTDTTTTVTSPTDTTTSDTTASDTTTPVDTTTTGTTMSTDIATTEADTSTSTTTPTSAILPAFVSSAQTTTAPSQSRHHGRGWRWGAYQNSQ
jgi:RNA polymerase sigma factor (sigma-70 family)